MNDVYQQQTASCIKRGSEVINWDSLLKFSGNGNLLIGMD